MMVNKMNNNLVDTRRNDIFLKHFGVSDKYFMDVALSALLGKYEFDVLKFDAWCHREQGYKEEIHGSCRDFIAFKWGEDVANYIGSLLEV